MIRLRLSYLLVATILLLPFTQVRPVGSSAGTPLFRDATVAVGLDFEHDPGESGQFHMPEIMGSGGALFDYDGDGDLDLFLVQGMDPGPRKPSSLPPGPKPAAARRRTKPGHRLYRNELIPSGRLSLTDVSIQAGVNRTSYGMGAAVGDIDSDGDQDLLVTGYGPDFLFRNNGNGTFTESGQKAGIADPRWSTSAAFLDFDRDGDLDLYVTNYVDFTVAGNKRCTSSTGEIDYCTPAAYRPVPDILYRNDGGGNFTDVTSQTKIGTVAGPGLGVTAADFDGDGWVDIYVANDGAANLLWINQKDGTFAENGLLSGSAYAMSGIPRAGMGATAGDFDNDGDPDILVTNLSREGFTLFRNNGRALFDDYSDQVDLTRSSFRSTGFGVGWFDYDNDGWLDLFAANGAVTIVEKLKGEP
ncbi:MAG: FG-GAP repeat domain-containing protein, partial [Acidobacteriota bacterium]